MRRQRQLPADQYDHLLVARTHPVEEVEVEPGVFQQRRGPCRVYERRVELVGEPAGHRNADDNDASDHKSVGTDARDVQGASTDSAPIEGGVDEAAVELTLDIEVDVPVWRPIINNFMALRILDDDPRTERLTPKKVIDRRVAHDIGILALIAVALGYLAALVSQTNTYIRTDFLSKGEMRSVLAWIRMAGLVAFPVAWMADRVGRRPLLLWGPPAAILAVAVSGLAQNAWQFTLAQIFARGITIGLAVVLGIAAIEIVPAGSRATVTSPRSPPDRAPRRYWCCCSSRIGLSARGDDSISFPPWPSFPCGWWFANCRRRPDTQHWTPSALPRCRAETSDFCANGW